MATVAASSARICTPPRKCDPEERTYYDMIDELAESATCCCRRTIRRFTACTVHTSAAEAEASSSLSLYFTAERIMTPPRADVVYAKKWTGRIQVGNLFCIWERNVLSVVIVLQVCKFTERQHPNSFLCAVPFGRSVCGQETLQAGIFPSENVF